MAFAVLNEALVSAGGAGADTMKFCCSTFEFSFCVVVVSSFGDPGLGNSSPGSEDGLQL
jgi:hypothetical protein